MSAFASIKNGDRAALRALLDDTGAAIDACLKASDVAVDDDLRVQIAKDIWFEAALMFELPKDDRGTVLAYAAARCAERRLADVKDMELDKRIASKLAAKVAAGVASESEKKSHTAQCEREPRLTELAKTLSLATEAGRREKSSGGSYSALWTTIEPLLK